MSLVYYFLGETVYNTDKMHVHYITYVCTALTESVSSFTKEKLTT